MSGDPTGAETRRERVRATPRARRALRRQGGDPSRIAGTGPGGRIVEADVLAARATESAAIMLSPLRQMTARQTALSFSTIPHFYLRAEVDASNLLGVYEACRESVHQACGIRPTLTDFLLRALALGLRDCPDANRIWRDETLIQMPQADVGLVVSLEGGLRIPVLRGADRSILLELAKRRSELVAAARAGRLPADAMQPCASGLSNLGSSRVDEFTAVIPPPQSTILAVGRIAPRPFVADGKLDARPTIRLCLSVDHRVLDGVPAARFLERIIEGLEQPQRLFAG
jgi:pyruvate dehydrogenase E2 component (dihydrolipoamide acetyltransferase)